MIATVEMISLALGFTSGTALMWLAMLSRIQTAKCAPALSGVASRPAPVAAVATGAAPVGHSTGPSDQGKSEPVSALGSQTARDRVLEEPALVSPREHAIALIAWVKEAQLPHMTAKQLEQVYGEMCVEQFWTVHPWQTIATQLHKITGEKPYAYVNGVRKRIYRLADVQLPAAAEHAATQEQESPLAIAA